METSSGPTTLQQSAQLKEKTALEEGFATFAQIFSAKIPDRYIFLATLGTLLKSVALTQGILLDVSYENSLFSDKIFFVWRLCT